LRQNDGMVAQHPIGAEVGRAAIQQVGDGSDFPTRSSRRAHLAGPTGRHVHRSAHGDMIFELTFDDYVFGFTPALVSSAVPIGNRIGLSRCSLRPGTGWLSILDTKMVPTWLMSSASSSV